jgi:hypothetical protein
VRRFSNGDRFASQETLSRISPIALQKIVADSYRLRSSMREAMANLIPFSPHYEALFQISADLSKGLSALGHIEVVSGPATHPATPGTNPQCQR